MNLADVLKQLAPALGSALAGPLGGIAAGFIADKLGVEEKTVKAVTDAIGDQKLTAEQLAGLKAAEIEFAKFCKQHDIDLERITADNTKSARDMQATTRSRIPGTLAIIVTVGFFGILVSMLLGVLKVSDQQALLLLLGSLSTAFGSVLNFYFGSSHGSTVKSELLAQSAPVK